MTESRPDSDIIWPDFNDIDFEAGHFPYSVPIDPILPWDRPFPLLARDRHGQRLGRLTTRIARHTHGSVLSTYRDAILAWSHCVLAGNDFQCFFAGVGEQWAREIAAHPPDHHWRREAGVLVQDGKVGLDRRKWQPQQTIYGRVLLASPDEPWNWGLHLLYAVPAAQYFLDHRERFDKFLCSATPGNLRELLRLVGITDADFVAHDALRTYRIEELHMFRHSIRDLYLHERERRILRGLADKIVRANTARGAARIYLSRRRRRAPNAYRELLDEPELIEGLERLGFVTLDPDSLPPEAQIHALASANIVVGLGGAGMFNTVFCKPGTLVIDIESSARFVDAHSNIFASCGHDYAVILGREDLSDPSGDHRRWTLDVPATLADIETLVERKESASPSSLRQKILRLMPGTKGTRVGR